ncbi:hypothetical protein ACROYT_G016945, partial [Oculina patagonica]
MSHTNFNSSQAAFKCYDSCDRPQSEESAVSPRAWPSNFRRFRPGDALAETFPSRANSPLKSKTDIASELALCTYFVCMRTQQKDRSQAVRRLGRIIQRENKR